MNQIINTIADIEDNNESILNSSFTSILPQHQGYATIRSHRYPSVGNQLEAIWEILKDIPTVAEHPSFVKMQEKILEVKELYPKNIGQDS
jgi:UDP-N-acetylglucosamine 2-epimerase